MFKNESGVGDGRMIDQSKSFLKGPPTYLTYSLQDGDTEFTSRSILQVDKGQTYVVTNHKQDLSLNEKNLKMLLK